MVMKINGVQFASKKNTGKKNNAPSFKGGVGVEIKYLNNDIFAPMEKQAKQVLENLMPRIGQKGQFLNWINLPKAQLKRVDYIYETADKLKRATGNDTLVVAGIGGSKHTLEHVLNLSGLGNERVKFYSDIDPMSLNKFKEELGGEISKSNYEIVSKSGTTFEVEDAYVRFNQELKNGYKALGYDEKAAQTKAGNHFVAVTDAGDSSKLRRIANEEGYLGQLFVHDDVGGRYSALDDHGLFTLAYAGMKKSDMIKMLESAQKMTGMALDKNIQNNPAMKRAIFYADSIKNGIGDFIQQLFGKHFESGTENWLRQLHFESLKDSRLGVAKAPDSMHYAAESHFDPRNKFNATLTMYNTGDLKGFDNYKAYTDSITGSYSRRMPTSVELLEIDGEKVTPEALGAYSQLKGFETIYKGMMRRAVNGIKQPEVLDEVLQPSVEAYKKEFKGGVLKPGE